MQKVELSKFPDRNKYLSTKPFPHCVVDGFLSLETVKAINSEWPSDMNEKRSETSIKRDTQILPPAAAEIMQIMGSTRVIDRLQKMTGIKGLIFDREMRGGGLHEIENGGFLKIHVDFNESKRDLTDEVSVTWYRRLNVLIYLNEDLDEKYGGQLEIHGINGEHPLKFDPIAGRLVAFNTSEHSWHGHPEPLKCPPWKTRRSMAFYYYTKRQPVGYNAKHSTIYRG